MVHREHVLALEAELLVRMLMRVPVSHRPDRRRDIQRPTPYLIADYGSARPPPPRLWRSADLSAEASAKVEALREGGSFTRRRKADTAYPGVRSRPYVASGFSRAAGSARNCMQKVQAMQAHGARPYGLPAALGVKFSI